ncbi:MAG: hypothetical protein FWG40_00600 [Peptococcaceae bacterium]|nr:hypothetical protein [Peptococcaceae bacterium]
MKIEMHRGDTCEVTFRVTNKGSGSPAEPFDEIFFTVKESPRSKDVFVQKRLSNGEISFDGNAYRLMLMPDETDGLDFGRYAFDIELVRGQFLKRTYLGVLMLGEEVTHARDEL